MPPERFGLLQALLAYLLARCGEDARGRHPGRRHSSSASTSRPKSLEEHLQLLNLVNFGGGCYAVYTELQDGQVHVEKELFGDTFRSPPRLTPLEARAIRLALEFVGPMIAADAHTPLERVRAQARGDLRPVRPPPDGRAARGARRGEARRLLSEGIRQRRLVEIEYQKEGEDSLSTRLVEPYMLERQLPNWYVHTWDRTRDAQRSFRLDRMRSARLQRETFEPREGFRPDRLEQRSGRGEASGTRRRSRAGRSRRARGLCPTAQRSRTRRSAARSGSLGEILADRGEAVLLEPENLRKQVARSAQRRSPASSA